MTDTPDRIWIDPSYLDSRRPALACNLGTAHEDRRLPGDREYLARDGETVRAMVEALRPFAEAWGIAIQQAGDHPGALRTLGPLGALASHQISGVHFRRARTALRRITGEG